MSARRLFVRMTVAALMASGTWAFGGPHDGPDKPTERHADPVKHGEKPLAGKSVDAHAEQRAGAVTGILISKGEGWIEVKAEGEEAPKNYTVVWIPGATKEGGRPDEKMIKLLQKIATNNLVQLMWRDEEGQRKVVAIREVVPPARTGAMLGVIVGKGDEWIEVKPPKAGYTERYIPRWVGGMPQDGGGFDKDMIRTFGGITVGDKVKLQWMYDERKRVVRIEKFNAPAPEADVGAKEKAPTAEHPAATEKLDKPDKSPKTEKTEKAEPEAKPAAEKKEPGTLPDGAAGFKGYLIGSIVSLDDKGCGLKVEKVVPLAESKAAEPDALAGRQVRLLFITLKNEDGGLAPSKELVGAVTKLTDQTGPVTVKAWIDAGQGLIMDKAWAGVQENPEAADAKGP